MMTVMTATTTVDGASGCNTQGDNVDLRGWRRDRIAVFDMKAPPAQVLFCGTFFCTIPVSSSSSPASLKNHTTKAAIHKGDRQSAQFMEGEEEKSSRKYGNRDNSCFVPLPKGRTGDSTQGER